jgi:ATP-dependent exoDNAse (exonuclease V) alpha subunit
MTLRNNRQLDVNNDERGVVTDIDVSTCQVTVRSERGGSTKTLPRTYLESGLLTHSYATTIHKAQGMTCDVALTLASDTLYQEAAYTALSRGRIENRLYLVDREPERADVRHAPELDDDRDEDWIERALERSKAKAMALTRIEPSVTDAGYEIDL